MPSLSQMLDAVRKLLKPGEKTVYIFILADKESLDLCGLSEAFDAQFMRDRIEAFQEALGRLPDAVDEIYITMNGYENEPRDLHEVPAVRTFVAEWAILSGVLANPLLSNVSRLFITRCIGLPQ